MSVEMVGDDVRGEEDVHAAEAWWCLDVDQDGREAERAMAQAQAQALAVDGRGISLGDGDADGDGRGLLSIRIWMEVNGNVNCDAAGPSSPWSSLDGLSTD